MSGGPRIIAELDVGWQTDAACRDYDPDAFFDETRAGEAAEVCAGCPVVVECGELAVTIGAMRATFAGRWRTGLQVQRERTARRAEVAHNGRNRPGR